MFNLFNYTIRVNGSVLIVVMLKWLWTVFTWIVVFFLSFFVVVFLFVYFFFEKRVVGEYDDTTTKQASVSEGQKVHTPSTLALK